MRKALRVSFRVPVEVRQENGRYIATCFLLDVQREAPSKHEALEGMVKAVQLHLYSRFKDRTIDSLLRDHDLEAQPAPGGIEGSSYVDVSVMLKAPPQQA